MNIKSNVAEIKKLLHERKKYHAPFLRFLMSKGVALPIAREILQAIDPSHNNEFALSRNLSFSETSSASFANHFPWPFQSKNPEALQGQILQMSHLKEAIAERIHVTGEICFDKPLKLLFVGPTGIGKTTTIVKLAQHYLHQQRSVALMSFDESDKSFLSTWAKKLDIPLVDHIDTTCDLLLIDTEGCNFYLPHRVDTLGEKLAEIADEVEVVLTLSAAAKEVDLYGAVHQFSALGPKSFVFTKLDETLAAGSILNVLAKCDIPIRYISLGFPLPGEIQVADSSYIAHKILTDFNHDEFQILRQLTLSNLN